MLDVVCVCVYLSWFNSYYSTWSGFWFVKVQTNSKSTNQIKFTGFVRLAVITYIRVIRLVFVTHTRVHAVYFYTPYKLPIERVEWVHKKKETTLVWETTIGSDCCDNDEWIKNEFVTCYVKYNSSQNVYETRERAENRTTTTMTATKANVGLWVCMECVKWKW